MNVIRLKIYDMFHDNYSFSLGVNGFLIQVSYFCPSPAEEELYGVKQNKKYWFSLTTDQKGKGLYS